MKILILIDNLKVGGAQSVIVALAKFFRTSGHEVRLLSINPEQSNQHDLGEVSHKGLLKNYKPYFLVLALFKLHNEFKDFKPDVFLSSLQRSNILSLTIKITIFSKFSKFIVREANTSSVRSKHMGLKEKIIQFFIKFLYKKSDLVITPSRGIYNDLYHNLGINQEKMKIISNPISKKSLEFKHVNLPENYILGVGRLEYAKGFDLLISAFQKISKTNPNLYLVIVGDGNKKDELKHLVDTLNINDRVIFYGYSNNPLPIMKKAKVFVLSSRWEGLPNVLIEAMFCDTKLVSFNCPSGPSDILENGKYGTLCKPKDVNSLSKGIEEALKNKKPDYSTKLNEYKLESIGARYVDAFESLINKT